jgi:hypothetical protein
MARKHKRTKIIDRWPVALIMTGGVLTLFWSALLIWFLMSVLHIV